MRSLGIATRVALARYNERKPECLGSWGGGWWVGRISPCCCSVTQACLTLCNPMDCSTPGFPVHHQLPELTQTHVHWVGDAIQSSHPLQSPSPHAFSLSQHQGFFQWVSSSHQMARVLELQLQRQSFQWIFKVDFLQAWLVWSPCRPAF